MQYLEDNEALIQTINDTLNLGRAEATVQYQQQLQRNLMWLAAIADAPAAGPLPSQVESLCLPPAGLLDALDTNVAVDLSAPCSTTCQIAPVTRLLS